MKETGGSDVDQAWFKRCFFHTYFCRNGLSLATFGLFFFNLYFEGILFNTRG